MSLPRPWLKNYDPGVPFTIHYPDLTIPDLLKFQAEKIPSRTAIVDGNRKIIYSRLFSLSQNFAFNLLIQGLNQKDTVGICLPNTIEFAISFYGVLLAGGIVSALNPAYPRRELAFQVGIAAIKYVIIADNKIEDFIEIQKSSSIRKIFLVNSSRLSSQKVDTDAGVILFNELISQKVTDKALPVISPESSAVLQFSGGTTGIPKAAIASHRNIVANVTQFRSWLVNLEAGKETFLVTIPLYHVYGMVLGLNLGVVMGARMVFLPDARSIDLIVQALQKFKISYFPAVPTIFQMISRHPDVIGGNADLSKIKASISGSAPLPQSVKMSFEERTGGHLVEGYGLSEAPTATHCNPIIGENRNLSIGFPLPDVDCMIIDIDSAKEVNVGEIGELLIRGPQIMAGYFNNPEETSTVLRDGWLHTGDIAWMDVDGYFYLVGRLKDLIKVNGLQVWPMEVEEVINLHPLITECAVAGVPDEDRGERVKSWVVLKPGERLTISELQEFCVNKLVSYKIPAEIEVCGFIPKTPVGKVLRRELVRFNRESNTK